MLAGPFDSKRRRDMTFRPCSNTVIGPRSERPMLCSGQPWQTLTAEPAGPAIGSDDDSLPSR